MKKTQFAAFLLSGLLILNTAIPAFAEGMTQQAETYKVDTTAPIVTAVSLNKTAANAGETLTLSIEASDDVSGISSFIAKFEDKDGRIISSNFGDETLKAEIELSEYEASGTYHLDYLHIMDKQGNDRYYIANPTPDTDKEELPNPLSFTVTNTPDKVDTTAPVVTAVSLNKTAANAGETLTLSIEASDDVSGISSFIAKFEDKDGRIISSNFGDETLKAEIELSEYEASGTYHLDYLHIMDKQGNDRYYIANPTPDTDKEELPNPLSFIVKNDDELVPGESDEELVPGQSENRPSKPERPSKPHNSGSSSGAIVNYDSEKPDPADKKATEMYNFWKNVKRKIKNTEEGKTLRVAVPAEYTYMPASVMETLRLNPQIGLKLSWGRDTVVIKAGTAQPKQKLKAYWTKSALLKLYTQR